MTAVIDGRKVFGVGLNKTGTTSLGDALNLLGIRTIHYPFKRDTYDELRSGRYRLSILEHYQGAVDTSVAPYYAQLDAAYPGSKFVLTVRDVTSWLRSIEAHWPVMREWCLRDPQFGRFTDFISAVVYGCIEFEPKRFVYAYETHARNVRDYFRGRDADFLEMDIGQGHGWEQLCPFLGLDVPDVPFPHSNQGRRRGNAVDFIRQFDLAKRALESVLTAGEIPILIDDGKVGESIVPAGRALPFTERHGQYAGPPADDETAIAELIRLRRAGARKVVVTWPSFWWLDHYRGFRDHLATNGNCLLRTEQVQVFDIGA